LSSSNYPLNCNNKKNLRFSSSSQDWHVKIKEKWPRVQYAWHGRWMKKIHPWANVPLHWCRKTVTNTDLCVQVKGEKNISLSIVGWFGGMSSFLLFVL
jgi:hypothetical protein